MPHCILLLCLPPVRLVEQHIAAFQFLRLDVVDIAFIVYHQFGTEILEPKKVRVEPPSANLVASGFGYCSPAEASEQRSHEQDAASQ